ncbi:MAG: hypothetical protein ABIJ56_04470, partial [Pseudomonadota bacterium]
LERLGDDALEAMKPFDEIYAQESGVSPLAEVAERLAAAHPSDAPEVDLKTYKGLKAPWNEWKYLAGRGGHWATVLSRLALDP